MCCKNTRHFFGSKFLGIDVPRGTIKKIATTSLAQTYVKFGQMFPVLPV
jgi:hypothetical protein